MKKKREGTLEEFEFSSAAGDDMRQAIQVAQRIGVSGLADFLEKADQLVEEMGRSGPLRAKRAQRLRLDLATIREALAAGGDEKRSILYAAVGAGLTYANLANEKRFDEAKKRGKFTRSEYFAAKRECRTRAELAERLDVSDQGLRKWETSNLK